jgi:hypothetical protein
MLTITIQIGRTPRSDMECRRELDPKGPPPFDHHQDHPQPSRRSCRSWKVSYWLRHAMALRTRSFGSALICGNSLKASVMRATPCAQLLDETVQTPKPHLIPCTSPAKLRLQRWREISTSALRRRPPVHSSSVSSHSRAQNHCGNCRRSSSGSISMIASRREPCSGHRDPHPTEGAASAAAGALVGDYSCISPR